MIIKINSKNRINFKYELENKVRPKLEVKEKKIRNRTRMLWHTRIGKRRNQD